MAEMIESEITRLNKLTTRLLRTARLDRDDVKPRLEPVDIGPFVGGVVHRYMARYQDRSVPVNSRTFVEVPADFDNSSTWR